MGSMKVIFIHWNSYNEIPKTGQHNKREAEMWDQATGKVYLCFEDDTSYTVSSCGMRAKQCIYFLKLYNKDPNPLPEGSTLMTQPHLKDSS